MKLNEALRALGSPPVGVTSLLAATIGGGDFRSVSGSAAGSSATLADAEAQLRHVRDAQNACQSDAAYWGYQGQASYWSAVVDVLKAAAITGPDSLPDIPAPDHDGPHALMDHCSIIERFGRNMLVKATGEQP